MLEMIKIGIEKYPEYFTVFFIFFLLIYFINFLTKNNQQIKSIFSIDYNKRIEGLEQNKTSLGDRKLEFSEALDNAIETLAFISSFGYDWPEKKRSKFLRLYKLAKSDWSLRSIKLLNANCTINEGLVSVSTTKATRRDFIWQCVLAFLFVLVGIGFFYLSFFVTKYIPIGRITFQLAAYSLFAFVFVILARALQKRKDLKKMKAMYNGKPID